MKKYKVEWSEVTHYEATVWAENEEAVEYAVFCGELHEEATPIYEGIEEDSLEITEL